MSVDFEFLLLENPMVYYGYMWPDEVYMKYSPTQPLCIW